MSALTRVEGGGDGDVFRGTFDGSEAEGGGDGEESGVEDGEGVGVGVLTDSLQNLTHPILRLSLPPVPHQHVCEQLDDGIYPRGEGIHVITWFGEVGFCVCCY